ncbi:MAG: hypothetical protein HZB56_16690 [Deltaproteobacteria bacterium]|nr:hypothetical protein [Deltaproteobacteria bacterium]
MKRTAKRKVPAGPPARQPGPRIGQVTGLGPGGVPLVDWPANRRGPLPARVLQGLERGALAAAASSGREVLLWFEGGDPRRPILVGLLQPPGRKLQVVEREVALVPEVARVDGKRVAIEGQDEVVLRCGRATITLRRNGKVVIAGTFVESRSAGVQRIKGAAVKIN